jgi:phytoene synthase
MGARSGRAWVERAVTRSPSNFRFAFFFLGPQRRDALAHLYRFCRAIDDIADTPGVASDQERRARLSAWERALERLAAGELLTPPANDGDGPDPELVAELSTLVRRRSVPIGALRDIVRGCRMDLEGREYETVLELEGYAMAVSSSVGFAVLPILTDRHRRPTAQAFARHLGLALQLTNILRDVAEDSANGRTYLPRALLVRHELTAQDVACGVFDERFRRAADELADRAEGHVDRAGEAAVAFPRRADLLAAEIMGRTYRRLLVQIRERGYDVYSHRPKLRRREKLEVAARALARAAANDVRSARPRARRLGRTLRAATRRV